MPIIHLIVKTKIPFVKNVVRKKVKKERSKSPFAPDSRKKEKIDFRKWPDPTGLYYENLKFSLPGLIGDNRIVNVRVKKVFFSLSNRFNIFYVKRTVNRRSSNTYLYPN